MMATHQHGASPCRSMPQLRSRRQLRRREAGWEAAGGELSVRRITNSIRRDVVGEPPTKWRSLKLTTHAMVVAKAMSGHITWLEAERWEGESQ